MHVAVHQSRGLHPHPSIRICTRPAALRQIAALSTIGKEGNIRYACSPDSDSQNCWDTWLLLPFYWSYFEAFEAVKRSSLERLFMHRKDALLHLFSPPILCYGSKHGVTFRWPDRCYRISRLYASAEITCILYIAVDQMAFRSKLLHGSRPCQWVRVWMSKFKIEKVNGNYSAIPKNEISHKDDQSLQTLAESKIIRKQRIA